MHYRPTDPYGDAVSAGRREEIDERVSSLLEELTLEEKVGQLTQENAGFETGTPMGDRDVAAAIEAGRVGSLLNVESIEEAREYQRRAVEESRLGIPLLCALDVIHGYRTVFPIPLGETASWDLDTIEETARIAATEAAADGVHWTFAPSIDVSRDPRWGRVMESAGEDPHLASEAAAARVRGFQGDDPTATDTVLACAKHFLGYGGGEGGREYNTVDVSDTTLREQHLPPFAAAAEAGVGSVMNAFNVHERIPASGNEYLLRNVLRDELGFDGVVVSDWNSFGEMEIHGAAADVRECARRAIEAGSDVDMVSDAYPEHLADLVRDGVVDESTLDEAVRRILEAKALLGLFEDPYRYFDEERAAERTLTDDHRDAAREAARESQVLLQNDGTLPLDADQDVALVGSFADSAKDMLSFWKCRGDPADVVTLRETLEDRHGDAIRYAQGADRDGTVTDDALAAAVSAAEDADVVVAAVGEPTEWTGEGASRARLDLPGDQRDLLEALHETGTPVVAVLFNGRPLAIDWEAEHLPAILEAWIPGVEAGPAVADVLYGDADPGGRLPMSFPVTEGQIPVYYNELSTGRPVPDEVDLDEPPTDVAERFFSRYVDAPNAPLYPFGHGESYADFAYGELAVAPDAIDADGTLSVSVPVENVGERDGAEVVQLYVRDRVGSRARPVKELAGFEKVRLEAGESATVSFDLTARELSFWTAEEEWAAEPGAFDVSVGRSASDIVAAGEFELTERVSTQ